MSAELRENEAKIERERELNLIHTRGDPIHGSTALDSDDDVTTPRIL